MFEHEKLDGEKFRLVPVSDAFIKEAILELREPKNGAAHDAANRQQYAVAENVLVERFLPPETTGDCWPHDGVSPPWWDVVGHPPHGGIVASFNKAMGGSYNRELKPDHNVVAFSELGEEVLMGSDEYFMVRKTDEQELRAPNLLALRSSYFSN